MPAPLDAILFDLGGTLDGRGGWRDRFDRLLTDAGVGGSRDDRAAAFDCAESRSHTSPEMATLRIREMVVRHVRWQLESLGHRRPATASAIADRFVHDIEQATVVSRQVLTMLAGRGYKLAVVSNACGNAALLCEEYGFGTALMGVVDSHVCGVSKPDLAIFRHALRLVGTAAERTAFVGDSLDRDIAPAKALGLHTFWIAAPGARSTAVPAADVVLGDISELPAVVADWTPAAPDHPGVMRYV